MADPTPTEPVVCAGAVIRDDAGRLLLIERGHPPAKGSWSLPGGRVEPGEALPAAAAREVLEETGLVVDVGELILTVTIGDYLIHDFAATVAGGVMRPGDDASDVRWCAPDEVPAMTLSPGLLDELRRLRIL